MVYYYFETPVDSTGNNDDMAAEGFQDAAFDDLLQKNYFDWNIETGDGKTTTFVRAYLSNGKWFRVNKDDEGMYFYFTYTGYNSTDDSYTYEESSAEDAEGLDYEIGEWKTKEFTNEDGEALTLNFVTEFADVTKKPTKYYAVYSDEAY